MRIALVSHEYPPFRGGGIGTYATVMSAALARAGHEVHVVTNRFDYGSTDPTHAMPLHRDGNLWVHRVEGITDDWRPRAPHDHPGDLHWSLFHDWSPYLYYAEVVSEALERIAATHPIDVVEFPECAAEGYAVLRRKRHRAGFLDLPITVTLHSPINEIYQYNLYPRHDVGFQRRAHMEDYCIRHADAVNSPSGLLAAIVRRRLGLERDTRPFDVIPLPMDFGSIPAALPGPAASDPPTLFFVGRLEPRKGVRDLIDAAVRVARRHPTLTVDLAGKDCEAGEVPGSMTAFLRQRIPESLRPRFRFLGPVPRESLFARFASATACVFAAPWDNFPLSCVEAMACGACVVASDYTGMAEMIEHERSGLLFRAGDVDALATAIERAVEDGVVNAAVRTAARQRIRALCDPETAVQNRIAHYERTIEAHREAARRRPVAPPAGRPTLACLVGGEGSDADVRKTVGSVGRSAAAAGIDVDVAVVSSLHAAPRADLPAGAWRVEAADGEIAGLRRWREHVAEVGSDLLLRITPGETVDESYLGVVVSALREAPDAAWATTWMLPARGSGGRPYAGFDFSAPLELFNHHPVPFAVIRRDAWERVGGWRLELPPGWREWDLWVALAHAGLGGIVVPLWLARHAAHADRALVRPSAQERFVAVVEAVVTRSRELFVRHGLDLWLYQLLSAPVPVHHAAMHDTSTWRHWWQVTRSVLVRQWPSGARLYRRWRWGIS